MRRGLSCLWSRTDIVPQRDLAVVLSGELQGLKLVSNLEPGCSV